MERWQELFAETVFRRSADTAHDLKTPLNIGVLNLELLRMRLRKLEAPAEGDSKLESHVLAIDTELRRLATIFDAFFVFSVPPRGDEPPEMVDVSPLFVEAGAREGAGVAVDTPAVIFAHPSRIETLGKLFFEGTSRLIDLPAARISFSVAEERMMLGVEGALTSQDDELAKVFKFYYTDASGAPDLSLAISRLIAETYGGGVTAENQNGIAVIELILPIGDR